MALLHPITPHRQMLLCFCFIIEFNRFDICREEGKHRYSSLNGDLRVVFL